ncbi:Solute carrier family 23 member 1 [Mizuhopecten yessoensis]|uniref:Solute carrier family 23 member 1 n=2 Tax=Mizuhopecten yessoensis TaxID=6573 RepID=A0A210PK02_MIZYE|nr:Solute carrier family 23 member 1 [Mizuhopecten yessoensis]
MVGVLFMLFGIVGKLSALFITIPYPVLGGAMLIMVSMFTGVVFANLQHVDLRSNRNLAILGISVSFGLIVPFWVEKHPDRTKTGNEALDQLMAMLLGNPILSGAVLACLLDNTIAGSRVERGLTAWEDVASNHSDKPGDVKVNDEMTATEGIEIYEPAVPRCVRGWKGFKYIPFMPDTFSYTQTETDKIESA